MALQIFNGVDEIEHKWISFSDGAKNLKLELDPEAVGGRFVVNLQPTTQMFSALSEISYAVSAIRGACGNDAYIILYLPYLPDARADRVFEIGNASPLIVFADGLLALQPDEIMTTDPHSKVFSDYMFDQGVFVQEETQASCFTSISKAMKLNIGEGLRIVAPDKGARDKASSLVALLRSKGYSVELVQCRKERDVSTGRITSVEVPEVPFGLRYIVVDDICDGGGTFIPIAESLKSQGAGQVDLYVTHGIFSKGLDLFQGKYDNIYCWHTVSDYVNTQDINSFNQEEK